MARAQLAETQERTLPEVITREQVRQTILAATTPRMRVFLWTTYSLGLRLGEALNLWVYWLASGHAPIRPIPKFPALRCAACGEALSVRGVTPPERDEAGRWKRATLSEHSRAYLDRG